MSGKSGSRRLGTLARAAGVALVALTVLTLVAAPAAAGKRRKPVALSTFVTGAFPSASTARGTSTCLGRTHIVGGGWAVLPHFEPATNSGLQTMSSASAFAGTTGWTATSDAFASPAGSGTFAVFARCESNRLGRIATAISGSATVPSGSLKDIVLHCPGRTHVVTGGYSATGLGSYSNSTGSLRMLVLQSRRTAKTDWTVSALESSGNTASGSISASALCEKNRRGRTPRELTAFVPFGNTTRASGTVTCPSKQHVIGGGYSLTPRGVNPPVVGIDEFEPTSKSTWHLGLHTFGPQPAGASVATYAYCEKDRLARKRR